MDLVHFYSHHQAGTTESLAPKRWCYQFAPPSSKIDRGAIYFYIDRTIVSQGIEPGYVVFPSQKL